MACWHIGLMVAAVGACAALLTPFAMVFMVELKAYNRVWRPGLLAFIGILGLCLFALSMGFVNVWGTAVK